MVRKRNGTPTQVGAPSARYPNRTDLAAQHAAGPAPQPTQPVRVPTGGAYGSAQALESAQQAMPLPQPPEVGGSPVGGGAPPAMMPGTLTPMAAQGYTPPNFSLGSSPSRRPNEPLTAGMPMGPGAGPNPAAQAQFSAGALLAALAAATNDPLMGELAELADSQGF
jgi:hypothetical protein